MKRYCVVVCPPTAGDRTLGIEVGKMLTCSAAAKRKRQNHKNVGDAYIYLFVLHK